MLWCPWLLNQKDEKKHKSISQIRYIYWKSYWILKNTELLKNTKSSVGLWESVDRYLCDSSRKHRFAKQKYPEPGAALPQRKADVCRKIIYDWQLYCLQEGKWLICMFIWHLLPVMCLCDMTFQWFSLEGPCLMGKSSANVSCINYICPQNKTKEEGFCLCLLFSIDLLTVKLPPLRYKKPTLRGWRADGGLIDITGLIKGCPTCEQVNYRTIRGRWSSGTRLTLEWINWPIFLKFICVTMIMSHVRKLVPFFSVKKKKGKFLLLFYWTILLATPRKKTYLFNFLLI